MSATNPDFAFLPDRAAIDSLDPATREQRQRERDQRVEDYLNRHVLRRVRAVSGVGDSTAYSATAYATVTNAPVLTTTKASKGSTLAVRVSTHGQLAAAAAPCWTTFGVAVTLDGAAKGDFDVVVVPGVAAQAGSFIFGSGDTELVVAGRGVVTLTLRVKVNAVTTTWTSAPHGSLSIACVETHAP